MYRAKAEGKGRTRVFEERMQAEVVERLELEGELLRAIERDEIDVHYQPVIALDGQTLAGFEALARWTPPAARAGPAADVHPAGRGERVDRRARPPDPAHGVPPGGALAGASSRRPGEPPRIMSVNLSGRQLEDPNIVADVAAALARHRAAGVRRWCWRSPRPC